MFTIKELSETLVQPVDAMVIYDVNCDSDHEEWCIADSTDEDGGYYDDVPLMCEDFGGCDIYRMRIDSTSDYGTVLAVHIDY